MSPVPLSPKSILLIGDSLADGQGSSDGGGLRTALCRTLWTDGYLFYFVGGNAAGPDDICRVHNGTRGAFASAIGVTMTSQVDRYRPHIILCDGGINDLINNIDEATTYSRIVTMIGNAVIGRNDYRVIYWLLGPHKTASVNTKRLAVNDLLRAHPFDPDHVELVENPLVEADLFDTVHPTLAGYAKLAVPIIEKLKPHLPRVLA